MNLEQIYKECGAYLEGHFLLSPGKYSQFYLQSAKVLKNPILAGELCENLAKIITSYKIKSDSICSPALGGALAGYELARANKERFILIERVEGMMALRRDLEVRKGEKFITRKGIITTGGSALESAKIIKNLGGEAVAYTVLTNRGFCVVQNLNNERKENAKLPNDLSFFALGSFGSEIYEVQQCPLCLQGSKVIKPGSHGNQ